jgi:hypothetical protein
VALGVLVDKTTFIVLVGALSEVFAPDSTAFSVAALFLGTACTTLGAFLAGRQAEAAFLAHGLLVAAAGFVLSFARWVTFTLDPPDVPGALHPLWWEILGWALLAVAGVLGGRLAQARFVYASS